MQLIYCYGDINRPPWSPILEQWICFLHSYLQTKGHNTCHTSIPGLEHCTDTIPDNLWQHVMTSHIRHSVRRERLWWSSNAKLHLHLLMLMVNSPSFYVHIYMSRNKMFFLSLVTSLKKTTKYLCPTCSLVDRYHSFEETICVNLQGRKNTPLFDSVYVAKNLKIQIYRTIILSVVLYGCETWMLTLRDEHRLRVF
jgi:hypothetical protein